jgi:hypothetical protein
VLFGSTTALRQWQTWITAQKSIDNSGSKPSGSSGGLLPTVDRAVVAGAKALVARLEQGQIGQVHAAAALDEGASDGGGSRQRALVASELGLYTCEQGCEPQRHPTSLTKVTAVVIVDAHMALAIAGPEQRVFAVRFDDNGGAKV